MLDPLAVLRDPCGFLHYCYLSLKLRVYSALWPQCSVVGCECDADDWSGRALCQWHFDKVQAIRRGEAGDPLPLGNSSDAL